MTLKNNMSTITFVTCFLRIKENEGHDRPFSLNLEHFTNLVATGIRLHVFVSEDLYSQVLTVPGIANNIVEILKFEDLECYQHAKRDLPDVRTAAHDTDKFLILQNAKIEIVKRAIDSGLHDTEHYAWIDFSIFHVIRNTEAAIKYLSMLGQSKLNLKGVVLPGCWNKSPPVLDQVMWRFCGGYFLGDRDSLLEMYQLHRQVYQNLTKLTWEVNVWAIMEYQESWKPLWFKADHNDTMIRIPYDYFYRCACLTTIPSRLSQLSQVIASLQNQVDHIFIYVPDQYKRFPNAVIAELPASSDKVTVVRGPDYGAASKYLGSLSVIPEGSWILFCDDDQEYHLDLLSRMFSQVIQIGAYQNRLQMISRDTSGGAIHGFVGNLIHKSCLNRLDTFDLPPAAEKADDQWMSIYCHKNKIPIFGTGLEHYCQIFSVLERGHEKWGVDSLSATTNRAELVTALEQHFQVKFYGILCSDT